MLKGIRRRTHVVLPTNACIESSQQDRREQNVKILCYKLTLWQTFCGSGLKRIWKAFLLRPASCLNYRYRKFWWTLL